MDLEYVDGVALVSDNPQVIQHALDRLAINVSLKGNLFASLEDKVFLQY